MGGWVRGFGRKMEYVAIGLFVLDNCIRVCMLQSLASDADADADTGVYILDKFFLDVCV